MTEYINKTLAKAQFTGDFQETYTVPLIKALIDEVPTADVVEGRHGKWKPIYEDAFRRDSIYEHWVTEKVVTGHRCSKCDSYSKTEYDYCPNCGTTMDGKE